MLLYSALAVCSALKIYFVQKVYSGIPLLTCGPLALFYGGQEIIPSLSSDLSTATSSNLSIYILSCLSPTLQLLIHLYKRLKFKKEIRYEQRLQQAVMSGVRNVYGPFVIFVGFLGFILACLFHLHVSNQNSQKQVSKDKTAEELFTPILWLIIIFSFMIFVTFARNRKLR